MTKRRRLSVEAREAAYEAADAVSRYSWKPEVRRFDRLLDCLPDRAWIE